MATLADVVAHVPLEAGDEWVGGEVCVDCEGLAGRVLGAIEKKSICYNYIFSVHFWYIFQSIF